MLERKKYSHLCKITLLIAVMFALAPCAVKQTLFTSLDVDYATPLTKAKALAPQANCHAAFDRTTTRTSAFEKHFSKAFLSSDQFSENGLSFSSSSSGVASLPSSGMATNVPKYILYKQMKSYLASLSHG